MSAGAAGGQVGLIHDAAYYGSDEELLALVVPFLIDGLNAGEPTFAVFAEPKNALLRDALPDPSAVTFLNGEVEYDRPTATLRNYRQLMAAQVAAGVRQVRVVGGVPYPGGARWSGWARYEAALNHVFANFPAWALCPYDTRITPDYVLADVARTHPHLATVGGKQIVSANYLEPAEFLSNQNCAEPDPLEDFVPTMEIVDPVPGAARRAVEAVALACGLLRDEVDDLVAAVHEAITNAFVHGRRPVRLRVWAGAGLGRVVVAVTDRGRGPSDPFAGLLPAPHFPDEGLGLWLIHQLCRHVTMSRDEHGFTIRMVAGKI